MRKSGWALLWKGSACVLALGAAQTGWASEADAGAAVAADSSANDDARAASSGDDIIVTARRREERLQDVPLAISVLGGAQLERQGVGDLADLGAKVPGLVVANSLGGGRSTPTFAIRGQSQQELAGIADPSVTLYVNDIAVPRPHGSNISFFDIGSIEVAKGPQGTLFGRNTTGGAILVRTQRPKDHFEGYVSQMVGNRGAFTTEAMINVPLGDVGAIRVAGQHLERDGYIHDVILDKDINSVNEEGLRVSLDVQPLPGVKNQLTVGVARADNGGTGGISYFSLNPLFAPGIAAQKTRDIYHTASGVPMFSNIRNLYVDNQTTIELGDHFSLKNVFGYRRVKVHQMEDLDGNADLLFPVERRVRQHQISEELQLQGSFDRFDFILGGYYFREKSDDQALTTGALSGTGQTDPGPIEPWTILAYAPRYSNTWVKPTNTSYAVFFQGNYQFTDQLSLTAGIRQNWDKREVVTLNRAFIVAANALSCRFTLDEDNDPSTPETRPSLDNCVFNGKKNFSEITYNISGQFQPRPGLLFYVAHRHGYRSGGFSARGNSQARLDATFSPELVDDFELGVKADWNIDGVFLRTNIAAYTAKYKDMQRILQQGLAPPVSVTTNAGRAKIQGIEAEFIFRPLPMFELSGFYAFTDAKFQKFIGPNGDDLSPQRFPRAPRNTLAVTGQFILPVGDDVGDIRLGLTYTHQDAYDYSDDHALEVTQGGDPIPNGVLYNQAQIIEAQKLWDASFEWKGVLGSTFDLSAFVTNLTNRKYLVPYMGVVSQFEARAPGEPRTYGMKLRYRF